MARVPLSGSASPRLSPGGVRVPSVGHMPFFLILVVALLFGLTPTAGASVVRLEDDGTRLVVEASGTDEINNEFRSRARVFRRPSHPRRRCARRRGSRSGDGCTPDAHRCQLPRRDVRVVDVELGDGDDVLTTRRCSAVPAGQEPCPDGVTDLVYPPGLLPREAFVIATGDAGNDTLIGGAGRDDFNGGAGDDPMIAGDGGNDRLEIGVGPGAWTLPMGRT